MESGVFGAEFKTLSKVVERLTGANIAYMLTGSMALNFYGHPRATNDFDIVIEVQKTDAPRIISLFKEDFYISEEAVTMALLRGEMFNVIDNESVFKIDFIAKKSDPFSIQQFKRRQKKELGYFQIDVISPEDLVLAKLIWSQQTNSELQMKDIRNILQILGANLDFTYMEKWATVLGILQQLKDLYD